MSNLMQYIFFSVIFNLFAEVFCISRIIGYSRLPLDMELLYFIGSNADGTNRYECTTPRERRKMYLVIAICLPIAAVFMGLYVSM